MTNSFNNDIPDIYTDSSGDSSDDEYIKGLVSPKSNTSQKSAPNSQDSKTSDKVATVTQSTPKDTPKKAVLSDATSPYPVESPKPGTKSPKSPNVSTKKADKEGKEAKKAVKKQEGKSKKAKASADTNDLVKDKLKELVKGDGEGVESHKVELKEDKEAKDLTVTFDKEPKKKVKKVKPKDDKSSAPSSKAGSTETSLTTSETVSQTTSGASTPKRKRAKKAPAPKEEAKVADGMDLDNPDTTVKVDTTVKEVRVDTVEKDDKTTHKVEGVESLDKGDKEDKVTKSEKSDAPKRKTKGDSDPKPKKPRVSKAAKSAEAPAPGTDKPVATVTEDKAEKSDKTEKAKVGKGKAGKKAEKGEMGEKVDTAEKADKADKTQKKEKAEKPAKDKKAKKVESADKATADVHKASPTPKVAQTAKSVDKDKMTNDEVFDALSKLDDIPLGELKQRIRALAPSESDSDSDTDSSSSYSDSSVDLKALLKSESVKKPVSETKHSYTDTDTDSDSDSDDSGDAFIGPVKPTMGASGFASGLIGSSDDDSSTDSDDSDDSVKPVVTPVKPVKEPVKPVTAVKSVKESGKVDKKVKKEQAKPVKEKGKAKADKAKSDKDKGKTAKKPSEEEELESSSPKTFMGESAGDQFINKERLETSFKGKADIPQGCEIYCGNLPVDATEDELRELFEECGLITRINKFNNKGIAFITFSTPEGAQKAAEYNNSPYKGKLLNINITTNRPAKGGFGSRGDEGSKFNFKGKPSEVTVSNEICIRNLNFNSSEEGLRELFSECGQVTRCYLPKFQDSGKPMGMCFITFTTVEAAKRAVEYDQTEIDGRTVSIQYAMPRNRFSNRGRAAKGRFTTGSPRASTFSRSPNKFEGDRRGGSPKFAQAKGDFAKSSSPHTLSDISADAKPKSIIFSDDDDE